jgi:hypothetical protein
VYGYTPRLSETELAFFIKSEFARVGANQNITPREIIRDFIEILNILLQNPGKTMSSILGSDDFVYSISEDDGMIHDEFKGFEI